MQWISGWNAPVTGLLWVQWHEPPGTTSDATGARTPMKGRAMLAYNATDLVELIRREMDANTSQPRVHDAAPGLVQQLRRRVALRRAAPR
jgi:hypothetical protein